MKPAAINREALEHRLSAWKALASSLTVLEFRDKAEIYAQGMRLEDQYWLMKGLVKLTHIDEEGSQVTAAILRGGDVFGNVLESATAGHTATAIGDVRVFRIRPPDIDRLIRSDPDFAARLVAKIAEARQRAEARLIEILTKTVDLRLITALKDLAAAFGTRCSHGYALEIRLTQQDLADLVCASRPVVTKAMNELRRGGFLDYTRDLICLDDSALEQAPARNRR
jgi:CRP/FNR family cyclic AMP-dependent transcriptional regulator